MGFLASGTGKGKGKKGEPSAELLRRLECRACPLDKVKNAHPHMAPSGASEPLLYVLGEFPSKTDDKQDDHFSGEAGLLLRRRIPKDWKSDIRFNNVVRTHPPGNKLTDAKYEVECCRPSVERDIAAAKPKAILAVGQAALKWAVGDDRIYDWRGRRAVVNIAGHVCWLYPVVSPAELLKKRKDWQNDAAGIYNEDERAFDFDIRRVFKELDKIEWADVNQYYHEVDQRDINVDIVLGGTDEDVDTIVAHLEWAAEQWAVGMDFETETVRPYNDGRLLTIAVGTGEKVLAFPYEHPRANWTKAQFEKIRDAFETFLCSKVIKMVHNAAFEMEWVGYLFGHSILRAGEWICTMVQAAVLDERVGEKGRQGPLSLNFLVRQHFGFDLKVLSPLDKEDMLNEPLEDTLHYNGLDTRYHYFLGVRQFDLIRDAKREEHFNERMSRVPTAVLTQLKGVPIDPDENEDLLHKYEDIARDLHDEIAKSEIAREFKRVIGRPFKPTNNHDVEKLLKDVYKCKEGWKTDSGGNEKYSTDEDVLNEIDLPGLDKIVHLRGVEKMLSTYIRELGPGGAYYWKDGLLHPSLNTVFTKTGRTSSDGPNEQNFPKRDAEGKEVRKQIRPGSDEYCYAFDYGQIQARIIAMASQDRSFIKALWDRYDIHLEWTEKLAKAYPRRMDEFHLEDDPIRKFRDVVKNGWTFPLFFGSAMQSVANNLDIPEKVISPLYDEFWYTFEGVKEWQERAIKFYKQNGYVISLDGTIRHAPMSMNEVINSPIQACETFIVMGAATRLSKRGLDYQCNMFIHDDLTFFRKKKGADEWAQDVVTEMLYTDYDWVNVPLTVEMSAGPSWYDLKKAGEYASDTWKGKLAA